MRNQKLHLPLKIFNSTGTCHREDRINRRFSVSSPGYPGDAELNYTKVELEKIQDPDFVMTFDSGIRGGISGCKCARCVVSKMDKNLIYKDSKHSNGLKIIKQLHRWKLKISLA